MHHLRLADHQMNGCVKGEVDVIAFEIVFRNFRLTKAFNNVSSSLNLITAQMGMRFD